jgi:hypothetical protein
LTAVASSGLPVSYAYVSGPGSLNGSTITYTGAGTVTLTANQPGNADYLAAPAVTIQIVVTKATPVVTWPNPSAIAYGTALSGAQLNATVAGVTGTGLAGTYAYSPAAGTVLAVGQQTLSLVFTPTDTTDYQLAYGVASLTVGEGAAVVSLTATPNPVLVQNAVTLTATFVGTGVAPTGSVTFLDGTAAIGSGTVSAGMASFTTSLLAAGGHTITAVYSGDANYGGSVSTAVTETVADFAITAGTTTQSVALGGTATYSLTLTPVGASTLAGTVTFTVSGLPSGATAAFVPASVAAGQAATSVVLTIVAPSQLARLERRGTGLAPIALALLLLPMSWRMRRRAGRASRWMLMLIVTAASVAVMSAAGCGSGAGASPQESFTLSVTGTSGSLVHSTELTLTVK